MFDREHCKKVCPIEQSSGEYLDGACLESSCLLCVVLVSGRQGFYVAVLLDYRHFVSSVGSAHAPTLVWSLFYSSAFKAFFLAPLCVHSFLFYLRGERRSSEVATSYCLLSSPSYF